MRYIIVTDPKGYRWFASFAENSADGMPDIQAATDSAAMHEALCLIDPGSEYSITFTNRKPRNTFRTFPIA